MEGSDPVHGGRFADTFWMKGMDGALEMDSAWKSKGSSATPTPNSLL
jgi:hypothetical protein